MPRERVDAEARRALTLLRERWKEFGGVRTLADVTVQRGGDRQRVRSVIVAQAPASVRFEALSPMGPPLLLATVHDGRLTAYDATTNQAFIGPATADTTARILSLPFEPEDLVAVLGGYAIPPDDVRVAKVLPPDDSGPGPSIEVSGDVNRRRIWMDLDTGVVHQVELTGGRAQARIRFRRAAEGGMEGFALTAMLGFITADVRYQNPRFDASASEDLFTFTVPNTAKIQEIR